MKKFIPGFYIILYSILGLTACQQDNKGDEATTSSLEQDTKSNGYTNPVLDKNFPDPTVIKAHDGYYYAYGTNTSINGRTVNMQIAKSGDLVNWEHIGDALPNRPTWADRDFWAPHVLYDSTNGTYYLYYSGESKSDTIGKCLGVATSSSPGGPFIDKGQPLLCGKSFINIDPMAYDDHATGKKLLYWGSGHEAIKVRELNDDRMSFKEGSSTIELVQIIAEDDPDNYQRLVEGAWIVYRDGYYYMFYSGDNCCGDEAHYAVMAARARQATGPFETMAEATGRGNSVILELNERWIAPGHNSVITDDAGQDWMIYHAIDSFNKDKGRVMLIDRVNYQSGWPRIEKGVPSLKQEQVPVVE